MISRTDPYCCCRYVNRDSGTKAQAAAKAAEVFTFSEEVAGGEEIYDNPAALLARKGFTSDLRGDPVAIDDCEIDEDLDDLDKP